MKFNAMQEEADVDRRIDMAGRNRLENQSTYIGKMAQLKQIKSKQQRQQLKIRRH
jgi:hypothetical protein